MWSFILTWCKLCSSNQIFRDLIMQENILNPSYFKSAGLLLIYLLKENLWLLLAFFCYFAQLYVTILSLFTQHFNLHPLHVDFLKRTSFVCVNWEAGGNRGNSDGCRARRSRFALQLCESLAYFLKSQFPYRLMEAISTLPVGLLGNSSQIIIRVTIYWVLTMC